MSSNKLDLNFPKFFNFLHEKLGIDSKRSDFKFITKHFTEEQIKEYFDNGLLTNGPGYFVLKDGDHEVKVFLYLNSYNDNYAGAPKAHLQRCEPLEQTEKSRQSRNKRGYVCSNEESVDWQGTWSNTIYKDQVLDICKSCLMILRDKAFSVMNTKEFSEKYTPKLSGKLTPNGYPVEWDFFREKYIRKVGGKCEICLYDCGFNSGEIHVHHKNGIKTDVDDSNLQCLCLLCHASQDAYHAQTVTNSPLFPEFVRRYRPLHPERIANFEKTFKIKLP